MSVNQATEEKSGSNFSWSSLFANPEYNRLVIGSLIPIGFFVASIVKTSVSLESGDKKWEQVKSEIMTVAWPLTILAILGFFINLAVFLVSEPKSMLYFLVIVCSLSLGLSISTLLCSMLTE